MAAKEESTRDLIIHLRRRDPFQPFSIVMASGERYAIDEPDALAIATSQVHYYPRSGLGIHLRLNQVASVEENGERRRRPPRRKAS
jgi:pyridoxine/pyridoxamine 5'-phosphate oxidase